MIKNLGKLNIISFFAENFYSVIIGTWPPKPHPGQPPPGRHDQANPNEFAGPCCERCVHTSSVCVDRHLWLGEKNLGD